MVLKYSGRTLPEWADSQQEVMADKLIEQEHTVWNVEEHRYTTSELTTLILSHWVNGQCNLLGE